EAHRDRDDQQGDDQLEEGEAPSIYFWLLSHEVTSAFSPSPPGAPSAPSDQRSYSPCCPGQQRYLYGLPHGSFGTFFLRYGPFQFGALPGFFWSASSACAVEG